MCELRRQLSSVLYDYPEIVLITRQRWRYVARVVLEGQYHPGRFSDWCTPEFVVISGRRSLGDESTIESVKNSFRLRGAEVFHTAEDGCVRVTIAERGIAVSTFRPHVRAGAAGGGTNLLQSE